jgi:hypothetical protein
MAKYLGWIPSIIGNLSYSLAGHSKYPERPKLCIFEYNNSFHYIISQTRISHDFQLGLASLIPFKQWSKKFEAFILEKKGLYSTWVPIMIGTCSCEHHGSIQNSTIGKDYQILKGKVFSFLKYLQLKNYLRYSASLLSIWIVIYLIRSPILTQKKHLKQNKHWKVL